MFGGSSFGESPFASPPTVIGVVKHVLKWLVGGPGSLWSAMRVRGGWQPGSPTTGDETRKPGSDWDADSPESNWQTPRGLDP